MSLYIGTGTNTASKIKQVNVVFNDGVDSDINPSNIKTGVKIFGVTGNFTANGTQTAGNSVATSNEIVSNHSAWVNGQEIIGNLDINTFYTGSSEPTSDIGNNGDIYLKR